ncbi:MAG: hypothetical protein JNK47_10855 [Mesorhizobium sp.]|nr:hypothetical protein [Mesorhizobium sp.]MBL8577717.1 hypothetical protein [Mesorhizobium sp.]
MDLPGVQLDRAAFEQASEKYLHEDIAEAIEPWITDQVAVRRAWPWLAFAINQYRFEREERSTYDDEMRPNDVKEMFGRISSQASKLRHELIQLAAHSHRLPDPKKAEARGHLGYLHEFFKQRIFLPERSEFIDDGGVWLATDFQQRSLERLLSVIAEAGEEFSSQHVNGDLLNRTRGQDDPALPNFVKLVAKVWTSLTGRMATANKVIVNEGEQSDFVRFVGALAVLAGEEKPPSRSRVATALG